MCLRLLLSYCFAAGMVLANVSGPLCEYPKGYITHKLWFTRGTSRWRAEESAMRLCLLLAKKQKWHKERTVVPGTSVRQRGSIINRDQREIIFSTPILQACGMLRRFKCTYQSPVAFYFFAEINPFIITNESRLLTQRRDAWVHLHFVGREG